MSVCICICVRRGALALAQLSSMADQMMKEKTEFESLSIAKQAVMREIDSLQRKTNDVKSLLEIEEKSLQNTRTRLMAAREETEKWENACITARSQADEEEMKLKHVKSIAMEQIKALQVDASKLHNDLKMNRRAIEDVDSNRRRIEEEAIKRRADIDAQLLAASRDLEEALRRTSGVKAEGRCVKHIITYIFVYSSLCFIYLFVMHGMFMYVIYILYMYFFYICTD